MIIRGFGLFALLGGLLSLLGWVLDVPPLTDWTGSGISIQPNTTVAVMSAGAALIALTRRRRWVVFVLGIVVAVLGATALLQYLTGVHLGAFNTALMFERTWGRGGVIDPGRMGPPDALCWTLIGTAFVLVSGVVTRRTRRYAPYLPLVTLAIATLSIIGHLYQASALYAGPRLTVIAFQTAVFITVISFGLIASVPQFGPMRLLRDDGAPRAALALPGATHRILIVDDNVDAATTLAELLGASGHETHVAYDGVEALQAAERLRPDVVLLDIGLPTIGGLEVCRRIREQPWGKRMILVALTGLGQNDDRRKSMAAGFDRHIVKPVDYEALLRLLTEQRAVSA